MMSVIANPDDQTLHLLEIIKEEKKDKVEHDPLLQETGKISIPKRED